MECDYFIRPVRLPRASDGGGSKPPRRMPSCPTQLFSLSGGSIGEAAQGSARLCDQFGTAGFNEVPGLRDNPFQNIRQFSQSGFTVDQFGCGFKGTGVRLDLPCRAQCSCSRFLFRNAARCHIRILHLLEPECKPYLAVANVSQADIWPEFMPF